MALKTNKPRMFSSYVDIVRAVEEIKTQTIDFENRPFDDVVRQSGQLEENIIQADSMILAGIAHYYSESQLRTNPWITPVMAHPENQGNLQLFSVAPGSDIADAYTAGWILEFTSDTKFKLTSSLEAAQGTAGGTDADFNSTNNDVTIETAAWLAKIGAGAREVKAGDTYYFSVIDSYPAIWNLSVNSAMVKSQKNLYTGQSPNENLNIENIRREVSAMIRRLNKPYKSDGMRLPSFVKRDQGATFVGRKINDLGQAEKSDTYVGDGTYPDY